MEATTVLEPQTIKISSKRQIGEGTGSFAEMQKKMREKYGL